MKIKASILLALSFSTVMQAQAANKVLLAEKINCGGYVSLEKSSDQILSLKVQISTNNTCGSTIDIKVPSQDIAGSLKQNQTVLPLQPRVIGTVLPLEIAGQAILMDLSNSQIQSEIHDSYTAEELAQAKRDREEINNRAQREQAARDAQQRRKNAAGAAAVGGAVAAGAGAVAIGAAASTER